MCGCYRRVPEPSDISFEDCREQTWRFRFLPAVGEWERFRNRRVVRSEDSFRVPNNFAWGSSCF